MNPLQIGDRVTLRGVTGTVQQTDNTGQVDTYVTLDEPVDAMPGAMHYFRNVWVAHSDLGYA